VIGAFAIYLVLAVIGLAHIWTNGPAGTAFAGGGGDPAETLWWIAWTPFAILHGHNPFFSSWVDAPAGINLAVNTSIPLPAALMTPITLLWGPVASLSVLLTTAFAASATAMFVVLRRWVTWTPAAFVGGLLYGFSPYMISHVAWTHVHLAMVPVPALMLGALDQLLVRQTRSPVRTGLWLGVLAAAQLLISMEILVLTAILCGIGLAVLVVARRREVATRARHALVGLGVAAAVLGVVAGYPVWMAVAGPRHLTGALGWPSPISSNLAGPFVPTANMHFTTPGLSDLANRMIGVVDLAENTAYLGAPLLLLVGLAVWRWRRVGIVAFSAAMAGLAFVLALGPTLRVGTDDTGLPLPATVMGDLPLTNRIVPARFSLFVALFAAVVLAVGLDRWRAAAMARPERAHRPSPSGPPESRWRAAGLLAVALVALVPLVPAWPYAGPSQVRIPRAMKASSACPLAGGGVLVTYPLPYPLPSEPMMWQATNRFCYRAASSYMNMPGPDGHTSTVDVSTTGTVFHAFYLGLPTVTGPAEVAAVRRELKRWGTRAVVVIDQAPGAAKATALLAEALQQQPVRRDGAAEWTISA
jgi:hypothetical protein